jgi:hypothetical protein
MVLVQKGPEGRSAVAEREAPAAGLPETAHAELAIGGMTCASCVAREQIEAALDDEGYPVQK